MSNTIKNKFIDMTLFVLYCVLTELLAYFIIFKKSLGMYFILDTIIFNILALPIFFSKRLKIDMIYLPIVSLIITLLFIVNANFYNAVNDVFSLQYIIFIKDGINVVNIHFIDFVSIFILSCFYLIFILSYIYRLMKINIQEEKDRPRQRIAIILTSLLVLLISFTFSINSIRRYENKKGHYSVNYITLSRIANFKRFGMMSYYILEFDYLNNGYDSNREELISFYKTDNKSKSNNYTGLLNGYNVFTIMIETGARHMVNEALTPNLYNMIDEGIDCVNNISKNKTNVSEFIGISGNYPTMGLKALEVENFEMPWTVPSNLNSNYRTIYMHDISKDVDIYRRMKFMDVFGFEETYFHDDLSPNIEPWTEWQGSYILDSETVDGIISNVTKSDEKFYAFWTSLSMHGPYYEPKNKAKLEEMYGEKMNQAIESGEWVNPLADTINEDCIRNYMLACMDFDVSLGKIISTFKEKGIYDNTLFVLYGDHDQYYVGADNRPLWKSLSGLEEMNESSIFKTVLVFSNPKLNEKANKDYPNGITALTSPYNIAPTILDLLGYNYNTKIYIGESIFEKDYNDQIHIFYSHELTHSYGLGFYSANGENLKEGRIDNPDLDIDSLEKIISDNYKKICLINNAYEEQLFTKETYKYYI